MGDKVYYTTSEVAEITGLRSSVFRFWETEFPQIEPRRTESGSRRYSAEQVELIKRICYLTRECGYTLSGVRDQLKADKYKTDDQQQLIETLTQTKAFLQELKNIL